MDNNARNPETVPYIVYQDEMARQERHIKRLWIALVAAVLVVLLTVVGFLLYINQFDFVSYDQDGEGVNIIGNLNGVDYDVPAPASAQQEEPQNGEGSGNP